MTCNDQLGFWILYNVLDMKANAKCFDFFFLCMNSEYQNFANYDINLFVLVYLHLLNFLLQALSRRISHINGSSLMLKCYILQMLK